MTPGERFLTALRGGMPDRLPMIIWNNKLPGGEMDEAIFELGVCLIVKSSVWKLSLNGIEVKSADRPVQGEGIQRTTQYATEAGKLTVVERILPGTVWIEKHPFETAADYNALEALIQARNYEKDFDRFERDNALRGDQSIARPMVIRSPLQEVIYEFMGIENFSGEWAENRERVEHLEKVVKQDWEKRVRITAESPAKYAVIDGNTEFAVVGADRFTKFYRPCIEQACEILHSKGVLAGAHLDGYNRQLAPLVAETSLDFIESFTPAPETDLSIREAREIWPDKALQIHFPSSVHLSGVKAVEEVGRRYLEEAAPGNGFIAGISEDLPDRGVKTMLPFFRFFHRYGKLPVDPKHFTEEPTR